ncbi:hypothetical protein [Aminipila sp.]|uniref:hypothetical protein n=1 Tax=Aminipila sp. TaxID=2060095 RepID=UPI00289F395A|nr:hypothetical protein [Aminipila sp.]
MKIVENAGTMMLMPAAPGTCPICATKHDPNMPHNRDSLYYQVRFQMENGRGPTWLDAMEHCSDIVKEMWTEALKEHGINLDKEKAPTEAATSDVSAHSNNQVKNTSDSKSCQDALNNI